MGSNFNVKWHFCNISSDFAAAIIWKRGSDHRGTLFEEIWKLPAKNYSDASVSNKNFCIY